MIFYQRNLVFSSSQDLNSFIFSDRKIISPSTCQLSHINKNVERKKSAPKVSHATLVPEREPHLPAAGAPAALHAGGKAGMGAKAADSSANRPRLVSFPIIWLSFCISQCIVNTYFSHGSCIFLV